MHKYIYIFEISLVPLIAENSYPDSPRLDSLHEKMIEDLTRIWNFLYFIVCIFIHFCVFIYSEKIVSSFRRISEMANRQKSHQSIIIYLKTHEKSSIQLYSVKIATQVKM